MKFLIPTQPDDRHAVLVKLALEDFGHYVRLLFTADQPTIQKNSVYINNDFYHWNSIDDTGCESDDHYDVVWWRRASMPYLPKDCAHPDDYPFVVQQNVLFYESLTSNMAPEAWWVNKKEASMRANNPLLQLRLATECGMNIPLTLCSNHPEDIRYFLLKYETEGVVYKPLSAGCWIEAKSVRVSAPATVKFLELPNNRLLQLSPGLFQQAIKKKEAIRVVCFGDYLVAVSLKTKPNGSKLRCGKALDEGANGIELYCLPADLKAQIKLFMARLGIVFGLFDFILTEDDQLVFNEMNEQGEFLWIEDLNPEIHLLDMFVNFLLNRSPHFNWDPDGWELSIERYENRVPGLIVNQLRNHVDANQMH